MKRFVGSEWGSALVVALLTLIAVGVTQSGAGGAYLFGIGFMAIVMLIKRRHEAEP
jgi:O-antigen ligase